MKLSELFAFHKSDKCLMHHELGHSYGPFYDELLTPLKDSIRTVFEIGVLGGASLRAWRDFFPNATVIGLDINVEPYEEDRIEVYRGDASDPEVIKAALKGRQPDWVCEDGSHWDFHQIAAADIMKPLMAPGAMMAIEDLQWPSVWEPLKERGFVIHDFRAQRSKHDDVIALYRAAI